MKDKEISRLLLLLSSSSIRKDPWKTEEILKKLFHLLERNSQEMTSVVDYLLDLARFQFNRGRYLHVLELLRTGRMLLKEKGFHPEPKLEIMLSRVYQEIGLWKNAWSALTRAQLFAEPCDFSVIASIYFNKGRILQLKNRFRNSLRMYRKATYYYRRCGMKDMVGRCYLNMAIVLSDMKKYNLSERLFRKALKLEKTRYFREFYHLNRAYILADRKRYRDAFREFKKAYEIASVDKNTEVRLRAIKGMGDCAMKGGDYVSALHYYKKAIRIFKSIFPEFLSPELSSRFIKAHPYVFLSAIGAAIKAEKYGEAFRISLQSKGITLFKRFCEFQPYSKEGNEILERVRNVLTAVKRRKFLSDERVLEEMLVKVRRRVIPRKVSFMKPEEGEVLLNFHLTGEKMVCVMTSVQGRIEAGILRGRKYRLMRSLIMEINEEIKRAGSSALVEDEFMEIRKIIDEFLPSRRIKKLSISPSDFLYFVPWQGIYPDREIEIYPSFYVSSASRKWKIPFLCLFSADDLIWADEEIKRLKKLFPDGIFLTGKRATKEEFLRLLPLSRYVHIIGHMMPDSFIRMGGIILPDGKEVSGYEISLSSISAEAVSLAICSSGMGKIEKETQEVLSLIYAFLFGGAGRVIGSYMPVDDRSSANYFVNLYSSRKKKWTEKALDAFRRSLEEGIPLPLLSHFTIYRNVFR